MATIMNSKLAGQLLGTVLGVITALAILIVASHHFGS
jgi:hypothetical protein